MNAKRRQLAGAGWFAVLLFAGWRLAPGGSSVGAQNVPKWVQDGNASFNT